MALLEALAGSVGETILPVVAGLFIAGDDPSLTAEMALITTFVLATAPQDTVLAAPAGARAGSGGAGRFTSLFPPATCRATQWADTEPGHMWLKRRR